MLQRYRLWTFFLVLVLLLTGCGKKNSGIKETDETTMGIDVARYQGTIDWEQVAGDGIDFAMIRVGYRANADGTITEDSNARYNLQQAQKYGVKIGVYFFSTAVSEEEAVEEANWVADLIAPYSITYPVAYDCENFTEPDSRQYGLSKRQRTDFAMTFLETVQGRGYQGMFYASRNDMTRNAKWDVSRIEKKFKIWVAQYPKHPYPETETSSYEDTHHMWQYATDGKVAGIETDVDLNVAYFGYDGIQKPLSTEKPEEAFPDVEALMDFQDVNEQVTAKDETNLRNMPNQEEYCQIIYTLQNGEVVTRIGISNTGWSKLIYNGEICYAVSSYLTTDLSHVNIETQFEPVSEQVTAKDYVNLRNIPSTTHEQSVVVCQLHNGDIAIRTGINNDAGWSRVVFNGQILYCVSSLLEPVK